MEPKTDPDTAQKPPPRTPAHASSPDSSPTIPSTHPTSPDKPYEMPLVNPYLKFFQDQKLLRAQSGMGWAKITLAKIEFILGCLNMKVLKPSIMRSICEF